MHFKMLVIGEDFAGLMLPYSEHLDDNAEGRWDYYKRRRQVERGTDAQARSYRLPQQDHRDRDAC